MPIPHCPILRLQHPLSSSPLGDHGADPPELGLLTTLATKIQITIHVRNELYDCV
jgi:hypothetical protein